MSAEVSAVVVPIREQQIKKQRTRPRELCELQEQWFAHIPAHVIVKLRSLKNPGPMILLHAAAHYRGEHKPISLPVTELSQLGYGSKAQISRAIAALESAALLKRTKEHGNGQCALFALGWNQPRRRGANSHG